MATRSTPQKRALAAELARTAEFRSAQDVHAALRAGGQRVGLTTVYNQLRALAEDGAVDVLRTTEGEARYRRCGNPASHHHHVVCRGCGHAVEVEGPEVEVWAARVAKDAGFVDVTHTVEVHGLCASCARR